MLAIRVPAETTRVLAILTELLSADEDSTAVSSVLHGDANGTRRRRVAMAQKVAGYGRKWKKWLAIYAGVGVVAYLLLFLLFFHGGSASAGGGFHY
jgi:hypothetical protein